MSKPVSKALPSRHPATIARGLQTISRRTLPLFVRVAADPAYVSRLAASIQAKNFSRTERLLLQCVPGGSVSVGAGFGVGFTLGDTIFEDGIFRPGRLVRAADLRAVSRTMLPLLRKLAVSRRFARNVAKLYLQRKQGGLLQLVRRIVPAQRIRSAGIDQYGFHFVVRLPNGANYNFIFGIE